MVCPMPRVCVARTELLLKEGDPHTLRTTDLLQRLRRPLTALEHLGEQGQAHGDDDSVPSQSIDGLIEERLLVRHEILPEETVRLPERRQHLLRMRTPEEIDPASVPIGPKLDPNLLHELDRRRQEIIPDQQDR